MVGVGVGVLVGATVGVGVGVSVGATVGVGVSVLVGATVGVGVGVSVGATVGVRVDVLFESTARVEVGSVLFLLMLRLVEVSSAGPQDTKETPNKNIVISISFRSSFFNVLLLVFLEISVDCSFIILSFLSLRLGTKVYSSCNPL